MDALPIEEDIHPIFERLKRLVKEFFRTDLKDIEGLLFTDRTLPFHNIYTPITVLKISCESVEYLNDSTSFLQELFERNERILVKGKTGTGKSFHIRKILLLYAMENFLNDYLIFKLDLSLIKSKETMIDSIIRQNFLSQDSETPKLKSDLTKLFECQDNKIQNKIILFFDEIDEFHHTKNEIYRIIRYKSDCCYYPYSIVVWSSNRMAIEISNSFHHIFEIVGFKEDQLLDFINKIISYVGNTYVGEKDRIIGYYGESNRFLSQLKEFDYVFNACSAPLIALIVVTIWIHKGFQRITQLSSIYDEIIDYIWEKEGLLKSKCNKQEILSYCAKAAFEKLAFEKAIIYDPVLDESNYFGRLLTVSDEYLDISLGGKVIQELTFSYRIFYDYFCAVYIIENGFSNSNSTVVLSERNIYKLSNSLLLIKSLNFKVYTNICAKHSIVLKNCEQLSSTVVNLLKNGFTNETVRHENLSNVVLAVVLSKTEISLTKLSFYNVDFDLSHFIKLFTKSDQRDNLLEFEIRGGLKSPINFEDLVKLQQISPKKKKVPTATLR